MNKIGLKTIRSCNSIYDLESLEIGNVTYDIGHRGGYVGFYSSSIANVLGINEGLLPGKIGAYVNYLGGGIRGSVCVSSYSDEITGRKKQLLDEILSACKRAFLNAENELGLNDDSDEDGDMNWEAIATKAARASGVDRTY